jgi:hypothetical protein
VLTDVFFSYCNYGKFPQASWLKTTQMYYFIITSGDMKSKLGGQSCAPSEESKGESIFLPFPASMLPAFLGSGHFLHLPNKIGSIAQHFHLP